MKWIVFEVLSVGIFNELCSDAQRHGSTGGDLPIDLPFAPPKVKLVGRESTYECVYYIYTHISYNMYDGCLYICTYIQTFVCVYIYRHRHMRALMQNCNCKSRHVLEG